MTKKDYNVSCPKCGKSPMGSKNGSRKKAGRYNKEWCMTCGYVTKR